MKNLVRVSVLFTLFSLVVAGVVKAQTNAIGQTRAITTAVPFLLIAPDSRFGALGDAGVALCDDASATHWNLSGLAFTKKPN